jgi:hypothetical protein
MQKRGAMTPNEYLALLDFLDNRIPLAKEEILHRLNISIKLAAGERWRRKKQKEAVVEA